MLTSHNIMGNSRTGKLAVGMSPIVWLKYAESNMKGVFEVIYH